MSDWRDGADTLEQLLSPVTIESFLSSHFNLKALFISGESTKFEGLINPSASSATPKSARWPS
jgi:hypothetical protein